MLRAGRSYTIPIRRMPPDPGPVVIPARRLPPEPVATASVSGASEATDAGGTAATMAEDR
jgi:hypothetical protein